MSDDHTGSDLDSLIVSIPVHATSSTFSKSGILAVGAGDGTVRTYKTGESKVSKAIRGLGGEISSVVFSEKDENVIWIACGRRVMSFRTDNVKLILDQHDIHDCINIGREEDVLNEIAMNPTSTFLAFSLDSGAVGIVDLLSKSSNKMKISHQSICGFVSFIPGRPNELVSGGYDCTLLHFDFKQGTVLSRYDIASPAVSNGVSLSPPFVQCIRLSSSGIFAAGTADGQIMLGLGGEKHNGSKNKKKRSRKWDGLHVDYASLHKVEEGPIVGIAFPSSSTLIICTLLGKITTYSFSSAPVQGNDKLISEGSTTGKTVLHEIRSTQTRRCAKVNSMSYDNTTRSLAVAGMDKDGKKGIVEIFSDFGANI